MTKDTTWITRHEAAEMAGRTTQTIDNWRRSKDLVFRKDRWGHVVVSSESLERILNPK